MALIKGGALRLFQTLLYVINFLCAGIILGIFSYFLAVLADRDQPIATWKKAVEGLAGAAVLYTIAAILLTCCLAGVTFFSFLGLFLDLCFVGAMIAIAVLTREGVHSCSGNVNTPLGSGPVDSTSDGYGANGFGFGSNENLTYSPNLGLACRLNKAVFIVAIIGAFMFLVTALMQIVLARNHKKEKAFGPSPDNNYTSGYGKRKFWQRKPKHNSEKAELGVAGTGAGLAATHPHHTVRPSHDTAYTSDTVVAPSAGNGAFAKKEVDPIALAAGNGMYAQMDQEPEHGAHAPHVGWTPHQQGARGGYYTTPQTQDTTPARNF